MLRRPRFADVDDFVMLQMTGMLVRQCSAGTGRKRGMLILNKDSDVLIESGFCDIINISDISYEVNKQRKSGCTLISLARSQSALFGNDGFLITGYPFSQFEPLRQDLYPLSATLHLYYTNFHVFVPTRNGQIG